MTAAPKSTRQVPPWSVIFRLINSLPSDLGLTACAWIKSPFQFSRWIRRRTKKGGISNRPVGVKHFQAIHLCSFDVSHGLALLFGIDTRALPSWDPRTRWNNLYRGLTVSRTAGPSGHADSPHPSSREGHPSTAGWISCFLLSGLILNGFHAAAAACSRVQRNSVP